MQAVLFKTQPKPAGKLLSEWPIGAYVPAHTGDPDFIVLKVSTTQYVSFWLRKPTTLSAQLTQDLTFGVVRDMLHFYIPYTGELRLEFINGQ